MKSIVFLIVIFSQWSFADSCTLLGDSVGVPRSVAAYEPTFEVCAALPSGEDLILLRTFIFGEDSAAFVVDPKSLQTKVVRQECLSRCAPASLGDVVDTAYGALLDQSSSPPFPLQNDGLLRGTNDHVLSPSLTIDMCPSSKGLSSEMYDLLADRGREQKSPLALGIAMTDAWMSRYPGELSVLLDRHREGLFDIVWINHSSDHSYRHGHALEDNFLLIAGTDFEYEVLGMETRFLEEGLLPSVFFRFPGLVSKPGLMQQLTDWGLLVLGSDAWLAKGEKPIGESIILVHGNRNEPAGEQKLERYLKSQVERDSGRPFFVSLYEIFGGLI